MHLMHIPNPKPIQAIVLKNANVLAELNTR